MLNDDRLVGFEHRRIIGIARNGSGILEVVETQMKCTARRDDHMERSEGLAIREKNRDGDVRLLVAGIEDARGFVADQRMIGKRALRGYPPFRNGPAAASDGLHKKYTRASIFAPETLWPSDWFRARELLSGWVLSGCDRHARGHRSKTAVFTTG
jgi:hypothetical protein